MNFENIFQPTINRLSSLVFRRYGCDFDYQTVTELQKDNLATLRFKLRSGEVVTAGDWVFFPVFLGEELAGAARISSRENMTEDDMIYLHQVIRLVLENTLNNIERLDILAQYEEKIESQSNLRLEPSNLVYLNNYHKNEFPLTDNCGKQTLSFAFIIESKNEDDLYKMALEVHAQSKRFAFLSIEDLKVDTFNDVASLRKLGPVTIYVADINTLSVAQQSCIIDHYSHAPEPDMPHFVCGTTKSVHALEQNGKIIPGLLKILSVGHLNMTQPFSFYKSRNILEFFSDKSPSTTST